jgi:hypothetical protein
MSATTKPKPDQVDRALADARRAIGKLVQLLDDEDGAIVAKAARALEEVGPFAVGPLAAALPRAGSLRLRLLIVGGLPHFARQARPAVTRALTAALGREKDPLVQRAVRGALGRVIMDDIVESATKARAPVEPAGT